MPLPQVLLAKMMGKKRVIAETGAGQHGVATATGAALFGLDCEIYMGTDDMERPGAECLQDETPWRQSNRSSNRFQNTKGRN